jgi:uncharacterized protein YcaQ
LRRQIRALGLVQLDSVSVLVRAHYLPLFSRLGAYDRTTLDRLAAHDGRPVAPAKRQLFEYWAHEASLLPVAMQPRLRWRMQRAASGEGVWSGLARWARDNRTAIQEVLRQVTDRGAIGVSELTERGPRRGSWWGWSDGKAALEWLFWTGQLTAARRRGFERVYDRPERVLPNDVLGTPTPDEADAHRSLLSHAAGALGVATEADLRDYFRLPVAAARARIPELVEAGLVRPVMVEGWRQTAYLAAGAQLPRRAAGQALLAPFDPLVWDRSRTERLFGLRYRIEIYTPAERRQHGYYVLPFLLGDRLAARVDLKSDRAGGRLIVRAMHLEASDPSGEIADALAEELGRMATWLGLSEVVAEGAVKGSPAARAPITDVAAPA